MSDNILNVSRRGFLQGMVSTGALVLSVRLIPEALWAAETAAGSHADSAVLHPSVFVGIDTDGTVYLVAHRSEMGTSSRTSVPLILADELDADWKRVKTRTGHRRPAIRRPGYRWIAFGPRWLCNHARGWSHGASDADASGGAEMGCAGFGMRIRSACDRAPAEQAQSRLWRTGLGSRQVARAQERRSDSTSQKARGDISAKEPPATICQPLHR